LLIAALCGVTGEAAAQDAAPAVPADWHYLVEPYFLAPNMSGTSGIGGVTADVDADPSDVFDKLRFGAMVYLEARNASWAASIDVLYMDLGQTATIETAEVDFGMTQFGYMLNGYRRVTPWAELMAGVTINSMTGSVTGSGPLMVDRSKSESWVDPGVGVRLSTPEGRKLRLTFVGTVGGFGVGSDFAWQAYPQIGFRAGSLLELTAAYRAMAMDYETGSEGDEFVYDMVTFGPQIGLRIHL
jgi:hypothetical protein